MKKILIRADAGPETGYGHFFRSLALADMLKNDFECTFVTEKPTEFQISEINKVCKLLPLEAGNRKFSQFLELLQGDEIVFLDNYFFTPEYQKSIKSRGSKLVCIGGNDRHYYADLLINTTGLKENDFSAEPYTRFCLGVDWVLLRKPFLNPFAPSKKINLSSVLVCFGGTDPSHITEKVIDQILNQHRYIQEIHLLATNDFHLSRLELVKNLGVTIHMNIGAEQLVEVFSKCDVSILSASSVALESLACKTPVIGGYYISNQERLYRYLCDKKYILGVGNWLDNDMPENLNAALSDYKKNKIETRFPDLTNLHDRYINLFKSL